MNDIPLSCLSFPTRILKQHLLSKRKEIRNNSGWCYLEPGYAGSARGNLRKLSAGAACTDPIVHVNMNRNYHFTDHYLTYESISKNGFTEWPGDLSYLFSWNRYFTHVLRSLKCKEFNSCLLKGNLWEDNKAPGKACYHSAWMRWWGWSEKQDGMGIFERTFRIKIVHFRILFSPIISNCDLEAITQDDHRKDPV